MNATEIRERTTNIAETLSLEVTADQPQNCQAALLYYDAWFACDRSKRSDQDDIYKKETSQ